MDNNYKNALKIKDVGIKLTVTVAFAVSAAIIYLSGVGCLFRYFFGFKCPGCGLTRALLSFFKLDFSASFKYHPLLLTTPVLYFYYLRDGHVFGRVADICILCAIFLAFFVRWIFVLT